MFFYTSLFIASLVVALVIVWLYNAVADVATQIYRAFLPSSKNNTTEYVREVSLRTTINDTRTPWGWNSHETPRTVAKTHAAIPSSTSKASPWGWPGSDKPKSAEKEKSKVSWPCREEESEFAGKSYKVTRKAKPRRTNLSTAGKPWGW